MKIESLSPGQVVRLNSGGPDLCVVAIETYSQFRYKIILKFYDSFISEFKELIIHDAALLSLV